MTGIPKSSAALLDELNVRGTTRQPLDYQILQDMAVSLDASRGTLNPNPGVQRMIGYPTVMASPPTVTQGVADAASTIASGVFTGATVLSGTWIVNPNAPWVYRNIGQPVVPAQTSPSRNYVNPYLDPSYFTGIPTGGMSIEFEFDGTSFDFRVQGQPSATQYRIWVDGQMVNAYGSLGPPAGGSQYYILVAFGSRANRRIRIDFTVNTYFGGITVGPNDTLWPPSTSAGPKVYVLGDSFVGGTGATSYLSAFWDIMQQGLGWRDVLSDGLGGTGYLKVNGSAAKYRDRITTGLIPWAPDIVIVTGGINDVGVSTAAQVQAEAILLFQQIRTALPNCKLIVLGNVKITGSPAANDVSMRDAIRTAATGLADLFIDPIVAAAAGANSLGWFTGTGKVGATTGSGNADLYLSSDGVHPTQAGHDYLGRRVATAIAAAMPF